MGNPFERPHVFTVFGVMGDLAHRKLLPSLYRLFRRQRATERCYVVGVSRRELSEAAFRDRICASIAEGDDGLSEREVREWGESHLLMHHSPRDYPDFATLKTRLEDLERSADLPGDRTFYLAIPPQAFEPVIERLGQAGLSTSRGATRLVIEKPFGRDLESARSLNRLVTRHFEESQVFRMDHFLGKTTVQNLLVLRFGNVIFESLWNRDRIERVEITAAETLGVESRGGYYDGAGAVRDMLQNHLTQLLTLVGMEAPSAFEAEAIRREKVKLLEAVAPIDPAADAVLGQYAAGRLPGRDEDLPAYRDEPDVPDDSRTETFALVRLHVHNWRWDGVPFYLRTGKRMSEDVTQVVLQFKCAPASLFRGLEQGCGPESDRLVIRFKPDEGFDLRFDVRTPDDRLRVERQGVSFRYEDAYGPLPDAYETLVRDVMQGDQTTFVHGSEAEAAWRLYAPLLSGRVPVASYAAGTWGPTDAGRLLGEPAGVDAGR